MSGKGARGAVEHDDELWDEADVFEEELRTELSARGIVAVL